MLENSTEECYAFPEEFFSGTLVRICDRIQTEPVCLNFGKENICNYRGILLEFWDQSPERFKRYIFVGKEEVLRTKRVATIKTGVDVLINLLTLTNFTPEDNKIINQILTSATATEIENIMCSEEWRSTCIELIKGQKWEILDRFELNCFLSNEKRDSFKRELSFTKDVQRICTDFAVSGKCIEVDSFIRWSTLSDEGVNKLKKEIIHSQDGRIKCLSIIVQRKNVEAFDKFVRWCFPSEEAIKIFKKELVFSSYGITCCVTLIEKHQFEILNEFINSCLSSEEDINRLKKDVVNAKGIEICLKLILGHEDFSIVYPSHLGGIRRTKKYIFYSDDNITNAFYAGRIKWEEVDEFLTWCFSCEEEKNDFKKNMLFKECGKEILFNFTKYRQWEEAENFFSWVGLSAEERKELKKGTLLDNYGPLEMLENATHIEDE